MKVKEELRKIILNSIPSKAFCDNRIKTTKYNWFTFLPLAILYQFYNYFNIFFLFTAIILAIKQISPMDPGVALAPFIFVIGVGVLIEALEDYKKAKYDATHNNMTATRINMQTNEEIQVKWSEIHVGDVIKLQTNESIPADMLVLKSSSPDGFCYMETTNLDGESGLKPRENMSIFGPFIKWDEAKNSLDVNNLQGLIEVEQPNSNIYHVKGNIRLIQNEKQEYEQPTIKIETAGNLNNIQGEGARSLLKIDNVLLRGATLKIVKYTYGIVIYTGKDTKIIQNIQKTSLKSSSIESTLNKVIIVIIIIVMSMCTALTVFGMIFMSTAVPQPGNNKAEYIYYAQNADYPYTLEFFQLFGAYFIIFNNIIPISLSITFTIGKVIQIIILETDKELKPEEKDQLKIMSYRLQEDLGNVRYIFTDKTGTLTMNEMVFKGCSIYTRIFYDEESDKDDNILKVLKEDPIDQEDYTQKKQASKRNSAQVTPSPSVIALKEAISSDLPFDFQLNDDDRHIFHSTRDATIEFFTNIALNHTVICGFSEKTQSMTFLGPNPDEVTLVSMAKDLGIEFIGRIDKEIQIKTNQNLITNYQVLETFPFTPERKSSGIIVRDHVNKKIKFYIKGADDRILDRIDHFSERYILKITKDHLDTFAKNGLRTLCYGVKYLQEEFFYQWHKEYEEIKFRETKNEDVTDLLEKKMKEIEKEFLLLGVSGLEDKLQDKVKEDILKFIEAGIQMWMVTGDKLDTAESIGYSSKFFDVDTEVFKIRAESKKEDIVISMKRILEEMEQMEKQLTEYKLARKKPRKVYKKKNKGNENFGMMNLYSSANEEKTNRTGQTEHKDDREKSKQKLRTADFRLAHSRESENFCEINLHAERHEVKTRINNEIIQWKLDRGKSGPVMKKSSMKRYCNTKPKVSESPDAISEGGEREEDSQVDDVSVFKFMLDKNFFDTSINKNNTNTFINRILQLAHHTNKETFQQGGIININIDQNNIIIQKRNSQEEVVFPSHMLNHQVNEQIISENDNIEKGINLFESHRKNNKEEERACSSGSDTEAVDLSNLYEHYKNELDRMRLRKESMRNILKFTNLDFQNYRRKKTVEQAHDVKELNLLNFGLIIEGEALAHCLDLEVKKTFWNLIKKSRSVICCRCPPIQKANIVSFVKDKSGEVCLAIGDGGNDISMIKEANVGIGIFGKEGNQAASNSDYAISQFKYLKRLLFFHGRYILYRNSYFVYFFFYKSLIFSVPNLWYAFFSGFSGTLLWDNLYFTCYTSILSTVPPVVIMVFEEDIDVSFTDLPKKKILKKLIPDIYREYRESSPFNSLKFFIVFFLGFLHSAIIYFFPLFVFRYGIQDHTGMSHSLWDQSLLGTMTVMIVQYYIIFLDTFKYYFPVFLAHSIQNFVNIMFFILYAVSNSDQLGAYSFDIISNMQYWFTLVITLAIALVPVYISRKVDYLFMDNIINNLRNRKFEDDFAKKMYIKKIEHMTKCTRSIAKFRKIYNALDKYHAENFADRKMKDMVQMYKNKKRNSRKSCSSLPKYIPNPPAGAVVKEEMYTSFSLPKQVQAVNVQIIKPKSRRSNSHSYKDKESYNAFSKRPKSKDIRVDSDSMKEADCGSVKNLKKNVNDDIQIKKINA